jgi:hypothetical protein
MGISLTSVHILVAIRNLTYRKTSKKIKRIEQTSSSFSTMMT